VDAEKFIMLQGKIAHHLTQKDIKKAFSKVQGLMITYGTK
jgi:hypothetical protein